MLTFRRILFICCALVWCGVSFVQAASVDTLYNDRSYDWGTGQRDSLPEWVFVPQHSGRVVAVSDPCMQLDKAKEQALLRAFYLYSLQQGATIHVLSDLYSLGETETNTYENLSNKMLIMAVMQQPEIRYSYTIEKEYKSIFGELYLLVNVVPSSVEAESYACRSMSEMMMVVVKERKEEKEIKLSLSVEADHPLGISQTRFLAKGDPDALQVESYMDEFKLWHYQKEHWYRNEGQPNLDSCVTSGLKHSFWSAYMTTFLEALLTHSFIDVNVKQVGEDYGGSQPKNQALYRERVASKLTVEPCIRGVLENNLYVDWKITPVEGKK